MRLEGQGAEDVAAGALVAVAPRIPGAPGAAGPPLLSPDRRTPYQSHHLHTRRTLPQSRHRHTQHTPLRSRHRPIISLLTTLFTNRVWGKCTRLRCSQEPLGRIPRDLPSLLEARIPRAVDCRGLGDFIRPAIPLPTPLAVGCLVALEA